MTAKLSVEEMCMFSYYIHYSPYLKCEGCWLPSVLGIWNIPLHRPTIVSKHSCTPMSLVPLSQSRNVLVETFTLFVTDGTKIVGRNPGGSPGIVSWGTYYIPYLVMTVTVHPQFHGSWGPLRFPKKCFTTLLNYFQEIPSCQSRTQKFGLFFGQFQIPNKVV